MDAQAEPEAASATGAKLQEASGVGPILLYGDELRSFGTAENLRRIGHRVVCTSNTAELGAAISSGTVFCLARLDLTSFDAGISLLEQLDRKLAPAGFAVWFARMARADLEEELGSL